MFSDDSCKFTKVLKSRREEEESTFDMDCAVEKADAAVAAYVATAQAGETEAAPAVPVGAA